jgi:hypothetical protein
VIPPGTVFPPNTKVQPGTILPPTCLLPGLPGVPDLLGGLGAVTGEAVGQIGGLTDVLKGGLHP